MVKKVALISTLLLLTLVSIVLIPGTIGFKTFQNGVRDRITEVGMEPCSGKPKILARNEWGATEPVGDMKRQTPDRITVHHTASRQRNDVSIEQKLRSLQKFSQQASQLANGDPKPAWPDVPYHFYINVDGKIAEGRNINFVGDTNTDYDPKGHVLIVLEGSFDEEEPSSAQLDSLRCLLRWVAVNWVIPVNTIKGHSDYASTACPGKNLEKEFPSLRNGR